MKRKTPHPQVLNPVPEAPLLNEKELYNFLAAILLRKQRVETELVKSEQINTPITVADS